MTNNVKTKEFKQISLRSYMLGMAVLWSLLIALSLGWNLKSERSITLEGVRIEARTAFEKDVVYRRWNAKHGEIYAPVTEATPSNPYLDVPERDITTLLGKKLTQINPAYMTRQAHELAKKASGVKGHITSLNLIRPTNAPDNWEAKALKAFQTGVKEVSSVEEMEGENYMRLMRPLLIEKACLKCHAKQGYKLGDIRGGISLSIPLAPRMAIGRSHILTLIAGHGLLWISGLFGIGFGMRRLNQQIHERMEAEKSLRENEKKYKSLTNNLNVGVYRNTPGPKGKFIEVNPAIVKMFGYDSKEEYLEGNVSDLYQNPDDRKEYNEKILRDGFVKNEELQLQKKDGTSLIGSVSAVALKDERGEVKYYDGIIEDITERKRAEEALRESEQRYRTLFERNPNPIAIINEKGRYLDANPAFLKFVERTKKSLLQMSVFDFSPPEKRISQESVHRQVWETGGTLETEYFIDDKIKILELTITPIFYKGIDAIFGVGKDITEHKQAEDALRESEEKYSNLFHFSNDGIFLHDLEGNIIDVNQKALDQLGYTKSEMLPFKIPDFHPPEALEKSQWAFETIIREGFVSFEIDFKKKTGEVFPAEVSSSLFEIGDKKVIQGIVRDITDRKQIEEEREKLINELQKALKEIKTLRGILPLCSFCKKIRDDKGYWEQVDVYIHKHLQADISHGICPACAKEHYPDLDIHE